MMKMSSIYLATVSGLMGCVCRKDLRTEDIKMLPIVGRRELPWLFPLFEDVTTECKIVMVDV